MISASGCGLLMSPEPDVRVKVSAAHFDADEDLGFEIRNDLDVPIRFSTCSDGRVRMGLSRREKGVWRVVGGHDPCASGSGPPRELEPGGRVAGSRPGGLEEGLYVLSFAYFEIPGPSRQLARIRQSEPFHVTD